MSLRKVCHFVGKAGSLAARQPRRGGVLWDMKGLKTSHFESFQSWTLRNVSHSEAFEAWRPEKASHFESFGGWRLENASYFESSGGWRLRKVSHVSHFVGRGAVSPSAWRGAGREGAFPRCLGLGMVPRGTSVGGWIWGARASLYSIVRICHEAWQGASVIKTPLPWLHGWPSLTLACLLSMMAEDCRPTLRKLSGTRG